MILISVIFIVRYTNKKSLFSKNRTTDIPEHTKPISYPSKLQRQQPWIEEKVEPGDSLAHLFLKVGLPYSTLESILKNKIAKQYLTNLKAKQTIYFRLNRRKKFRQLKYPIDQDRSLIVSKHNKKISARIDKKPITTKLLYKSGIVKHSLAAAAYSADLTPAMLHQLSSIFAGDIDYRRQLKPGAHFEFLYKEFYVNGKKYKPGNIAVAEFTNKEHTYQAIRYTYPINHSGYYTPDGHGVVPLFLCVPLKYKYISSGFSYHRMDPYLHVIRPHLGIDYAANIGTPIYSIGNGRVIFAGKDDGYGNAMIIRYSRKYKTLYGHMERFAKGIHAGTRVKRGELVGYVGNTGWSTGPHLHFEMYVYGIPRNPLKMHFPGGKSIPRSYEERFLVRAKQLLADLRQHTNSETTENPHGK